MDQVGIANKSTVMLVPASSAVPSFNLVCVLCEFEGGAMLVVVT